jgi:PAS domain S-box-containing protein
MSAILMSLTKEHAKNFIMTGQQPTGPDAAAAKTDRSYGNVRVYPYINKRQATEKALRASEERLRLLIESATDYAIFSMDTAGYIDSWNTGAERIFGWTSEEAIGQPGAIIFTPEDRAAHAPEREMKTARETGRALDERFHLRKDGSRFYVSGSLSPLYHNGRLEGYVKVARDLSERKQAEEALETRVQERTHELHQANTVLLAEVTARQQAEGQLHQLASRLTMAEQEERRRLSQILHDDLQQLLYGIQIKLELINQDLEGGQQEETLAHAQEAAAWIEETITMTRRLTVDLSPPVLQGEGLTAALSWLVTQMADLHDLQVEVEAERAFLINNDEDMRVLLFQIIRELLFNVVKHAQTRRARVTLREEAGQLVIEVSDAGRGFKVEAATAKSEDGFGLFSIRERLGLFGGRLEIASKSGEGARVTLYIPLKPKKREEGNNE